MNIISHTTIDNKIIELRDNFIIIDRDVAELYGVETKRVNEAVTKVVESFDHLQPIKYSPYLPKAFTKKGLWMLATIISSKERETSNGYNNG
jgi:hypothetical protein